MLAGSKIIWVDDLPEGTAVSVYSKTSSGVYGLCTNGGSLSGVKPGSEYSDETLFIKVEMSTTDPLLTPTLSNLFVQLLAEGDDHILVLSFSPGNTSSIQNAVDEVVIAYDGTGTLMGEGGPVLAFEHSFAPQGLVPKNNPHDAEHIELLDIVANVALSKIHYNYAYETEHVELADMLATGALIHVDDI